MSSGGSTVFLVYPTGYSQFVVEDSTVNGGEAGSEEFRFLKLCGTFRRFDLS
jgi:hypothetical protein